MIIINIMNDAITRMQIRIMLEYKFLGESSILLDLKLTINYASTYHVLA